MNSIDDLIKYLKENIACLRRKDIDLKVRAKDSIDKDCNYEAVYEAIKRKIIFHKMEGFSEILDRVKELKINMEKAK